MVILIQPVFQLNVTSAEHLASEQREIIHSLSKLQDRYKETARRSPQEQVLLILWEDFAECGNRKALRLRAQGVYFCK